MDRYKKVKITNTSNKILTGKGIAFELRYEFDIICEKLRIRTWTFKDFISDAQEKINYNIQPNQTIEIECYTSGWLNNQITDTIIYYTLWYKNYKNLKEIQFDTFSMAFK